MTSDPTSYRIVGVDPGHTTGVAVVEWDGSPRLDASTVKVTDLVQLSEGEVPVVDVVVEYMRDALPTADLVIVERYQITARTLQASRQYDALYVIGAIKALSVLHGSGSSSVVLSTAAAAKNAVDDAVLKEGGWYSGTRGMPHGRDALRHALLGCRKILASPTR